MKSLALHRLETAERFATLGRPGAPITEPAAYGFAIAIELGLKGLLLHRAWSDDRTKTLRHDLILALDAAEAEGLEPDADLRRLAAVLNRYYARHDWHLFPAEPPKVITRAAKIVGNLLARVRDQVDATA